MHAHPVAALPSSRVEALAACDKFRQELKELRELSGEAPQPHRTREGGKEGKERGGRGREGGKEGSGADGTRWAEPEPKALLQVPGPLLTPSQSEAAADAITALVSRQRNTTQC